MKKFKKSAAWILAAVMALVMAANVLADIRWDEDGNIIENEELEGGIMTLDIFDFDGNMLGSEFGLLEPGRIFGSVKGTVVEVWHSDFTGTDFIRITIEYYDGQTGYTDFEMKDSTYLMGDEPEIGNVITGFFDMNMPMILIYPPQYPAVVLINHGDNEEALPRVTLARFDEEWVSYDGLFRLRITEDTELAFQEAPITPGGSPILWQPTDEEVVVSPVAPAGTSVMRAEDLIGELLLVEFDISHRDIPETIFATRIILMNAYEAPTFPEPEYFPDNNGLGIIEWLDVYEWDYQVVVDNQGVPDARYATIGDSLWPNYVSLRAVTEFLGFEPVWNENLRQITVGSPRGEITFRIDLPYYAVLAPNGEVFTYTLDPPVIIGASTYVPLRFWRDVFGFNNAWWAHGNVAIDNEEVME